MKLTETDYAQVCGRAGAAGMSVPAWLAAQIGTRRSGSGPGGMGAGERRAWAAEFVAARRQLTGVATNVNQLARTANTTGTPPGGELADVMGQVNDAVARLSAALDGLQGRA